MVTGRVSPGFFVTIDGLDGSGKSQNILMLGSRFPDTVHTCVSMSSNWPAGALRDIILGHAGARLDPFARQTAICANYIHTYKHEIAPMLDKGLIVVVDRDIRISSSTYGSGDGLGSREINAIRAVIGCTEREPELSIVLDVPYECAVKRLSARAGEKNHYDTLDKDIFNRRRSAMLSVAQHCSSVVIDGSKSIKKVHGDIVDAIQHGLDMKACTCYAL